MGDCGRGTQIESCPTFVVQDMGVARDIAKRFEQLETQWLSFQKKSANWGAEKDSSQKSTTSSPRTHAQKNAVSSAASSYSNPLFTNHTTAKPAPVISDRAASSASSRTGSPYAGSAINSGKGPFSFRHRKPPPITTSPRAATAKKDDNSSTQVSPSASLLSSPRQNSGKMSKDGQVSSSRDTMYTRATVPTSFREKPPLSPAIQTMSKASGLGNEKHVSCASLSRHAAIRREPEYGRDCRRSLQLPDILGLECPRQSTSATKSSPTEESRDCDAEIHSITYSSSSDPATYSSGKGPPESQSQSQSLELLERYHDAHTDQSRSLPSASQIAETEADLQLNPSPECTVGLRRNISWRVLAERGVLTEGVLEQEQHPAEIDLEKDKDSSHEMPAQNAIELTSNSGNILKLEVQIDKKSIRDADNAKLGDRLVKVNWELRLSKREAALRIAEEKFLEEQQNLSKAQLAVSRLEDALRQKEHEVQRETEKQKSDMGDTLKSIETGKSVMKKLSAGLKDVLWQLDQKEKVLQDTWLELRNSVDTKPFFGEHSFGFEPEMSQKDRRSATFDGISFLIAEGKCEEWCSTVVGICERLVGFMSRETHLQKWATSLEKEGMRMTKMTKEMAKAQDAASEQCARAEEMMKCAEEQAACMDEERAKLSKERDNLILWVTHLQERRKVVAECEREAATSLAEVQKKAADLFVHESNIDGRTLEISALQEELRVTSQRLQDDQELIHREKNKVQEKLRQVAAREREADTKISVMKTLQEELNTKAEQLEKSRVLDEKRKEKLLLTLKETEKRMSAKEISLHDLEKELEDKGAAADEMTNNLNEREKLLSGLQRQLEQERSNIREMMASLENDKLRLKEAEEAVAEAHSSKKGAEEAWARTAQERRESTEYLKSVEERLKQWEDRLRNKEKELQGQQKKLQDIAKQAREEQEHSEALHKKLVQEQESWTQELKAKQESLSKRNRILDAKEEKINNDLERLTEERRVALEDIKRLAEMESRAWAAERELQAKHEEHLKEVRKHASEYHSQVEDLDLAKCEVKKEFEEVLAKKQELKIWQREAEETLQNRIDSFIKGKEELTAQIQELKKLQMDIEQAGSQIIDRVAELDRASTRLERQRHKVETSKSKLEGLADNLATHQEVLQRRESEFLAQETKLVAVQNGLRKMAAEAANKEKSLRSREQAVIDSENDIHDVEARLISERKDLEKMIAEVEQHAAKLKEEIASVEESSRSRTRDEVLIEEKRKQLQAKECELADFEADLKKKAKSLEEHGQTISKLELQVKERLQRAVVFETETEELERGWERLKKGQADLAIERDTLTKAKVEIQKAVETHKVQWQVDQEKDENRRKEEMEIQRPEMMEELRAREDVLEAREATASDRELALFKMERQSKAHKEQVEKDAQELRQQLQGARAELEDQRQHVEEKRKAAEAIAAKAEEREARLELREQELAEKKAFDSEKGHQEVEVVERSYKSQSNRTGASTDHEIQAQMLGMLVTGIESSADAVHWLSKSEKREGRLDYHHVPSKIRPQHVLVHNQTDEGMEERLRQMEDAFQKEAAKISQERADLKLQQQDLEETRKAVQEVKVTLTAQLKATKQMVADASLTAQNASREREALEEERKRLAQAQKDAEDSVAAKEAKLALEAKQLESMKIMLEQDKAKALELIQQAAKRTPSTEYAKTESSNAQWDTLIMQKEILCEANLKDRERELKSTAEAIWREKTNLSEEREQVKMLHDALERDQMEHPHVNLENAAQADALVNDAENRSAWEEIKKMRKRERLIGEAHGWDPISEGSSNDMSQVAEQEFSFSAMKGRLGTRGSVGNLGEGSGRNMQIYREFANQKITTNKWDEPFGSATSCMSATYSEMTPENLTVSSGYCQIHEKSGAPSRQRLDNVMISLMHARQASRSRLQRTENALLAFPPSSGFTTQVQQALTALSARLSLMEQIEEGLESHLRNAYETDSPESEGMIIDKEQLLCRMEEQQSLRAEWEEDMQRQLETISMLQASSRNSSNFGTPLRVPNQSATLQNEWQNHNNSVLQGGKGLVSYETVGRSGGNGVENVNADLQSGGVSRPPKQFLTPDWNSTFQPHQRVDSKGLSYSPLLTMDI